MPADPDAPVPFWPVYYTPAAGRVIDTLPVGYWPTPAADAALDEPEAN